MRFEHDLKPMVGIGILLGLGWVLIAFTTARAIQSDASISSRAVGVAIPVALALALFAGAFGIIMYGLEEHAFRIAVWTCLGILVMTFAVVLNIVGLDVVRPDFTLAMYMITTAAAAGATIGVLIGLYDAHQKRIQSNLTETRDESKQLSQRLSVLNRVLRHDIRTQAQLLNGYTDRMQSGALSTDAGVEKIQQTNDRLVRVSQDASRLQQLFDGDEVDTEPTDLVPLVCEAATTVQADHDALTVECSVPDRLLVQAPPMLRHAVEQVLHNVADHSDLAEPHAEITATTTSSPEPSVALTVADDGPGIPDNELIHTTVDSESPLHHSKGIGLWLVRWIVTAGGGEIDIETRSPNGRGTVVTLSLRAPTDDSI